jgi:hypothetical protein
MRKSVWTLVLLLGLVVSVVSAAGYNLADTYAQRVRFQWDRYGYQEWFNPARGSLDDGEDVTWTVTLWAGTEYKLIGACDSDCDDLDLEVFDGYGDSVGEDFTYGDYPSVIVRPRYTQVYSFRVTMESCQDMPCAYMIGTLGRTN